MENNEVKLGGYKHYKGDIIEVIGKSLHSETLEEYVTYKHITGKRTGESHYWVRPIKMFLENIKIDGKTIPRFKFVKPINNDSSQKHPKIGVGVYIVNDKNELLLQQRKGVNGEGTWAPAGGHLEMGESLEQCAKREAMEELGVEVEIVEIMGFTNDIFSASHHYITFALKAKLVSGTPQILEKNIVSQMNWFSLDNLPSPLFLPVDNFLNQNHGLINLKGPRDTKTKE